jgi:hypothetical protein
MEGFMADSSDAWYGNMELALWLITAFRAGPVSSHEDDWFGTEFLRLISADDATMVVGSLINGLLHTCSELINALAEESDLSDEEVIARLRRHIESLKGGSGAT